MNRTQLKALKTARAIISAARDDIDCPLVVHELDEQIRLIEIELRHAPTASRDRAMSEETVAELAHMLMMPSQDYNQSQHALVAEGFGK